MRLSTSSSDRAAVTRETHEQPIRGAGAPRALLLALVVLVLVELALRAAGPDRVLPYRLGGQEYQAAHDFVHTYGPADVCFVGSSRAREAIHVPTVRDRLEAALDRPVTVANYAVGGARAEETLTIVTKLLDGPHRPRVIFYGIEARQVLVDEQRFIVAARMWAMDEWLANYRAHGRAMFSYLPDAMRNEIGRHYKTFQSRKAVANFVDQQITGWTHTCPLRGEATPYQHNTPDRPLLRSTCATPSRWVN